MSASYGALEPTDREIVNPVSSLPVAAEAAANGIQQMSAAEEAEAGGAAPRPPPPPLASEELYLATLHILDALENRGYHRYRRMGPWARWATRMYRSTVKRWSSVALLGLLALGFVERPQWCRDQPQHCADTELFPRTEQWFISDWADRAVQALLLAVLWLNYAFLVVAFRSSLYAKTRGKPWAMLVLLVLASASLTGRVPARVLGPYTRVGLCIVHSRPLRAELRLIARMLPLVLRATFLLLASFFVFALFAQVYFPPSTAEGLDGFATLGDSLWSLFMLITTSQFPDLMIPAYEHRRTSALYFAVVIVLGYFFFLNLILAVVVNAYQQQHRAKLRDAVRGRKRNLKEAFRVLGGGPDRGLPLATFRLVMGELRLFPPCKHLNDEVENILVSFLSSSPAAALPPSSSAAPPGVDGDGEASSGGPVIDEQGFSRLYHLLRLRFQRLNTHTLLERWYPWLLQKRWYVGARDLIKSRLFEWLVDAVVALNVILVFARTMAEEQKRAARSAQGGGEEAEEAVEASAGIALAFSAFYMLELLLKVLANGWPMYWHRVSNRFDLVITLAAAAGSAAWLVPGLHMDAYTLRLVTILRLFRVARVFVRIPQFRVIGKTFQRIVRPASVDFFLLFCLMYCFSALGVELFGGRITKDPSSRYFSELQRSAFGQSNYYSINFNDMASGMTALFTLLTTSCTSGVSSGPVAVTSLWSRLYFVVFYFLGVLILLNIIVAFILQAFIEEWAKPPPLGLLRRASRLPTQRGWLGSYHILDDTSMLLRPHSHDDEAPTGGPQLGSSGGGPSFYSIRVAHGGKLHDAVTIQDILSSSGRGAARAPLLGGKGRRGGGKHVQDEEEDYDDDEEEEEEEEDEES